MKVTASRSYVSRLPCSSLSRRGLTERDSPRADDEHHSVAEALLSSPRATVVTNERVSLCPNDKVSQ